METSRTHTAAGRSATLAGMTPPRARLPWPSLRWLAVLGLALASTLAGAQAMGRAQALFTLAHELAPERAAAVARLAEVGLMDDSPRVAERLRDEDAGVRNLAGMALWMIWSRSGDAAVDKLFARGVDQMGRGQLKAARATFTRVIRLKPAFAEGWNKRATVAFLQGDDPGSLKDCGEALKRNPLHFGALSGMAQIHVRQGRVDEALRAWERALEVNPNIDGGPEVLEQLEEAVRQRAGQKT